MKYFTENEVHLGFDASHHLDTLCGLPLDPEDGDCFESMDKVSCAKCKALFAELKKDMK